MITEAKINRGASETPDGACRVEKCAKGAHRGSIDPCGVCVEKKKNGGKNHLNQSRIWIQNCYYNLIRMEKLVNNDESIPCALNRVLEAYYTPDRVDAILRAAQDKIRGV